MASPTFHFIHYKDQKATKGIQSTTPIKQSNMTASSQARTVASLPLYTAVALFGLVMEMIVKLAAGVASEC